jgi:hypothetical protein
MDLAKIKNPFLILVMFFMSIGLINAQVAPQDSPGNSEYSKEKLEKFVEATKEISEIQQNGEQKMIQVIEKEKNLDVETFNKIAEAMMNAEQPEEGEISEAEIESFNNVMPELQMIQMQMQQEMESAITDRGLEISEYQEVMEAYQRDPQVQQKINEMLIEN